MALSSQIRRSTWNEYILSFCTTTRECGGNKKSGTRATDNCATTDVLSTSWSRVLLSLEKSLRHLKEKETGKIDGLNSSAQQSFEEPIKRNFFDVA